MLTGAVSLFLLLMWKAATGRTPIQMLLNCGRKEGLEVYNIMRKKRISFAELHRHSCAAMGYFLPLYGRVVDDRPVAYSGETKQAIIFAMMRGSVDAGMSTQEFIQVIAKELKHFRDDDSPLTDATRQVDGIMF